MEISGTWGRVFEVDALATQLQFIGGEERAAANAMNQSSGMLVFRPSQTVMLLPNSTSMRAAEKGELYEQFGPISKVSSRLVVTLGFSGGAAERPLHTACCILLSSSISIRTVLDLIQMAFEPFGLQGPSGDCILGQCAPNQPADEAALLLFEQPNY